MCLSLWVFISSHGRPQEGVDIRFVRNPIPVRQTKTCLEHLCNTSVHGVVLEIHCLTGCLENSYLVCVFYDNMNHFILFSICFFFCFALEQFRHLPDSDILKEVLVESSLKVRFSITNSEIKREAFSSEYMFLTSF